MPFSPNVNGILTTGTETGAAALAIISNFNSLAILVAGKAAANHTHDDRYYTETETNNLLSGKSNNGHTHVSVDITDSSATGTASKVAAFNASGGMGFTDQVLITKNTQYPFKINDGTNDRAYIDTPNANYTVLALRGPYNGIVTSNDANQSMSFNDGAGSMQLTQAHGLRVVSHLMGDRLVFGNNYNDLSQYCNFYIPSLSADHIVLDLKGYSGQSASVVRIRDSGNTITFSLDVDGYIVCAGVQTTNLVNAANLRIGSGAPAAGNSSGVTGDIKWDSDFLYVCTDTDTWKRTSLSAF